MDDTDDAAFAEDDDDDDEEEDDVGVDWDGDETLILVKFDCSL